MVGYQQVAFASELRQDDPWVCTIKDRDGKAWAVWLLQTVLVSEFERWRPMPGERVVIRYKGMSEQGAGGPQPVPPVHADGRPRRAGAARVPDRRPGARAGRPTRAGDGEPPVDADVVEGEQEGGGR